jgi:DNA mismatch endonuclease (patch repair protein)
MSRSDRVKSSPVVTAATPPETSRSMAAIRTHGSASERSVRVIVAGLGIRYRLRNSDLPGSPDLANRRRRFAIFVHGCFWHRHARCGRASVPKTNAEFWRRKFNQNFRRDRRTIRALKAKGFVTIVNWECELREPAILTQAHQSTPCWAPTEGLRRSNHGEPT